MSVSEIVTNLAGTTVALAIALIGWVIHVRECRANMKSLREENARLIETLTRLAEREKNHEGWRRAP